MKSTTKTLLWVGGTAVVVGGTAFVVGTVAGTTIASWMLPGGVKFLVKRVTGSKTLKNELESAKKKFDAALAKAEGTDGTPAAKLAGAAPGIDPDTALGSTTPGYSFDEDGNLVIA